jgi:hypothetical protein
LNNKAVVVKKVGGPTSGFNSKTATAEPKRDAKPLRQALGLSGSRPKASQGVDNTFQTGQGKPDLIIRRFYNNNTRPEGHPGHSYCEQGFPGGASKNLWFFVTNQGNAAAGQSRLKVLFNTFAGSGASSVYTQHVEQIAKGQSVTVKVPIPTACYPGNFYRSCHFRIVTDAGYQVAELNEVNNHIDSKCTGAAE